MSCARSNLGPTPKITLTTSTLNAIKKFLNAVNKKLQKLLKGNLIILGGLTYPAGLRVMDGIHTTFEGRIKFHKIKFIINK